MNTNPLSKKIDKCNELGIKYIWMQPGSESEKAISRARDYGIEVITACFMVNQRLWG